MLRLEAEAGSKGVNQAFFSGDGAVQVIAGIELNAWLRREDLQHAARGGIDDTRCEPGSGAAVIQHVGVVIADRPFQLLVVSFDTLAGARWMAKIERSACN